MRCGCGVSGYMPKTRRARSNRGSDPRRRRRSRWKERIMNTSTVFAALALSVLLSSAATVGAEDMKGMAMKPATSPADKAFVDSMKTMMNGMHAKPTGKPDADFARMMIPHHQGAIDMARVELQ